MSQVRILALPGQHVARYSESGDPLTGRSAGRIGLFGKYINPEGEVVPARAEYTRAQKHKECLVLAVDATIPEEWKALVASHLPPPDPTPEPTPGPSPETPNAEPAEAPAVTQ